MRLTGRPIEPAKNYKVAGWAPVAETSTVRNPGEPIWDLVSAYLRQRKVIKRPRLNLPRVAGVTGNRGMAA